MSEQKPSRMEQILDLLAQELAERMARQGTPSAAAQGEPAAVAATEAVRAPAPRPPARPEAENLPPFLMPKPAEEELLPEEPGPSHAARLMRRLAVGLLVALVLVNIPFNRYGTTLAKAMPDTASYIIRNGFVVKEEDDPEIYVYQDGAFRWISSLDAFEHYGYTWEDVHIVPDGYLDRYTIGRPIHVLLKCEASPHIYRLEDGKKSWIRDIDTFTAEGHVWEDVRFVSCQYLRDLPDGETIPPDSGPPPQP